MKKRQGLSVFALEYVPHPGSRETRAKRPPDGVMIRNEQDKKGSDL